jgi:hypothetical protein
MGLRTYQALAILKKQRGAGRQACTCDIGLMLRNGRLAKKFTIQDKPAIRGSVLSVIL